MKCETFDFFQLAQNLNKLTRCSEPRKRSVAESKNKIIRVDVKFNKFHTLLENKLVRERRDRR